MSGSFYPPLGTPMGIVLLANNTVVFNAIVLPLSATHVPSSFGGAANAWTGPLFWYTYQDDPIEDPANPENWFGLVRSDGSHKSAYAAYAAI